MGGNIYTSLIEKDGILYMGSSDHNFYAIELDKFLNAEPELNQKGYNSVDIVAKKPNFTLGIYHIKYKESYKTIFYILPIMFN